MIAIAANNPYQIDVENQRITGNGVNWGIEDINEQLPEDVEFEEFKNDCSCEMTGEWVDATPDNPGYRKAPEYQPTLIHRGDKWGLKICKKCGGVWAWHDARADYY